MINMSYPNILSYRLGTVNDFQVSIYGLCLNKTQKKNDRRNHDLSKVIATFVDAEGAFYVQDGIFLK